MGEFGSSNKRPRYLVRVYRTWRELQTALNVAWEHGYQRDELRREETAGIWHYLVIWKQVGATNGSQDQKRDYQGEIRSYIARQEERREQDRRARLAGLEARELEEGST